MAENEFKKISLREMMGNRVDEDPKSETTFKVSDEVQRKDIVQMGDAVFFENVAFVFNNNRYVNTFFINEIKDKEFSNITDSDNVKFDLLESSITLVDPLSDGTYYSTEIMTDKNYKSDLNNFFIVVDEDVPPGCDILYYIITHDNKAFPIKPNATTPLKMKMPTTSFKLKAELITNGNDYPKIRSYAILYHDQFIEDSYGLINPDLSDKDDKGFDDLITLVRDPNNEDKLKEVVATVSTVKLTYDKDNDNRLCKVEEFRNLDDKKLSENRLIYGDYLNSEGITENVLLQVSSKTQFKKDEE